MNTIGKKNMMFGYIYLLATLSLGIYMALMMYSPLGSDDWAGSRAHDLVKQAHVHGNLEALLNIISGFLICMYGAGSERLARATSVMLIIAALSHSGMFYLGGLGVPWVVLIAFPGGFLVIAAMAMMVPILKRGVVAR